MTNDTKTKKPTKEERLAKNLKANLLRRKQQDRKRLETTQQQEQKT
jgi:hypothetical protein